MAARPRNDCPAASGGWLMKRMILLATRGSDLALAQTREVARRLRAAWPDLEVREEIIRTTGDKNLQAELAQIGAGEQGLFTKELEEALMDGRADAAVHSLKDLPTALRSCRAPTAPMCSSPPLPADFPPWQPALPSAPAVRAVNRCYWSSGPMSPLS